MITIEVIFMYKEWYVDEIVYCSPEPVEIFFVLFIGLILLLLLPMIILFDLLALPLEILTLIIYKKINGGE